MKGVRIVDLQSNSTKDIFNYIERSESNEANFLDLWLA